MKHSDNHTALTALLSYCSHYNVPVIFDIDDNHLDIHKSNAAYETYKEGQPKRYYLSAAISLVSGLVVSTQPLKERYQDIQPNIEIYPNFNDKDDWEPSARKDDGKIRIGYAGSITHSEDFQMVVPALKEVLTKYSNVELCLLGLMDKEAFEKAKKQFRSVKGRVSLQLGTPSWVGYPELLASQGWDIGIAPLIPTKFNICRSHIKWHEYSMTGIATVASKTYPYSEEIQGKKTIEHDKTGMLAETTEEWVKCLSDLIENPEKRKYLVKNAQDYIIEQWQWDNNVEQLKKIIDKICNLATQQTKTD